MGRDDDPWVLGVLLGAAALLYLVSWLVTGPPPGWQGASESTPLEAALGSERARLVPDP
jgi:hypothetical protein